MTVTDAERTFYEDVLADTAGKSLSDLRYAYYLQALDTGGYITREYVDPSTGTVAPSSTPTRIGAMYIDTTAAKVYIAKGTTSSADWVALN